MIAGTTIDSTQEAKTILKKLITFNTTSSPNPAWAQDTTAATAYVAYYLKEKTGATVHFGEEYEYPSGSGKMHKGMIAVWNPESAKNKPALAFSGHIDVVPAVNWGPGDKPFEPKEVGDNIIGRGAFDMKGSVASAMATFRKMFQEGKLADLERPLVFMLSSCEEVGLFGAKGVCDLARKHNINPSEVVVLEPTGGYIGLGCKGAIEEELTFTRKASASETTHAHWPSYFTVSIQSGGGHSSLQGASPADPALAMSETVLKLVKQLRESNVPVEICAVDYGIAANVVGGKATLTIGFDPQGPGGDLSRLMTVPEALRHQLEDIHRPAANRELRFFTVIGNFLSKKAKEATGIDLGKVAIDVKHGLPENKKAELYRITVRKENGQLQSSSAIEHALEVVGKIYDTHVQQRNGKKPAGYALAPMAVSKLSVPILRGDSELASLTYDLRYPIEATQGHPSVGRIERTDTIKQRIQRAANANAVFSVKATENVHIKPYKVDQNDPRLAPFVEVARQTGFGRYKSSVTNLPYASDGNVIAKEFPDALVVTMADGTFANLAHGVGENLSGQQLRRNIALYEGVIAKQALPPSVGVAL